MEHLRTDVLIIGSEGAGARAAIAAADAGVDVTIVTKGRLGRSGATITGAADLDVDSASLVRLIGQGDSRDSPEEFFRDMVVEGKYLNDQRLAEVHVSEVPERLRELLEWGYRWTELRQMPGHSYPRNLYASGHEMVRVLKRQVRQRRLRVVEDLYVSDLAVEDGQVIGALGLDLDRGEAVALEAKAVVLAAGGGHNLYSFTTGPEELTGDGQAMALRAGARLVNMEMMQFIPTTIIEPPIARGNLFPFLVGPQNALAVWLLNRHGQRFMARWDPARMEHSTRDLLSIGIQTEILEGRGGPQGGVYFSLAHLPRNLVQDFARWGAKPFLRSDWSAHGLGFREIMDRAMAGEAFEVAPAAHFFMGGVRIDADGATDLSGLYAAGEVTGALHGANRLSGNAFAQIMVQGERAGRAGARYVQARGKAPEMPRAKWQGLEARVLGPLEANGDGGAHAYELKRRLQEVAAEQVGVVRHGQALEEAVAQIEGWRRQECPRVRSRSKDRRFNPEWLECLQLENMHLALEATARAALARRESRGAHYRRDYPTTDHAGWLRNTVVGMRDGSLTVETEPVAITSLPPPTSPS
ncbi:MAG: FAD-binding protein [Chloroflexi bacterium]|nr:FAD-binding protein [Chloroflexota bacterium]